MKCSIKAIVSFCVYCLLVIRMHNMALRFLDVYPSMQGVAPGVALRRNVLCSVKRASGELIKLAITMVQWDLWTTDQ